MLVGVSKSIKEENYKEILENLNIPLIQIMYGSNKHNLKKLEQAQNICGVLSHCRYYTTLTFPYNHTRKWVSSDILSDQLANYTINKGNDIKHSYAVIHMGKNKGDIIENVIDHCRHYLETIDDKSLSYIKPKLLFENEPLTNNSFSHDIDNLILLNDSVKDLGKINNFGYCIDTCHLNTVGNNTKLKTNSKYSLLDSNKKSLENAKWLLNKISELDVNLIHLNDAKHEYLDRHAGISKGLLNMDALKEFYKYAKKNNINIILENDLSSISYKEQLSALEE